jgi:hypothetical protein
VEASIVWYSWGSDQNTVKSKGVKTWKMHDWLLRIKKNINTYDAESTATHRLIPNCFLTILFISVKFHQWIRIQKKKKCLNWKIYWNELHVIRPGGMREGLCIHWEEWSHWSSSVLALCPISCLWFQFATDNIFLLLKKIVWTKIPPIIVPKKKK